MRKVFTIFIFAALLCSCKAISSLVHDEDVVARVGEEKLYRSDIEALIPETASPEDSAAIASRYINSWALDHLYMNVAASELSKSEIDVSQELETYRRSLVKYRYEQRYVNDKLDTLITEAQIKEYHHSHESEFMLERPVLRVRFVDVMKDSPNRSLILKLMASDDYDDNARLDTLAKTAALRYFDNSERWMDAAELAQSFGVDWKSMMSRIKGDMIRIEPEGRGDILAAYVYEICKSGVAPIDYCAPTIRNIILSNRKRELLKSLEQDLLDNALENKNFVIY